MQIQRNYQPPVVHRKRDPVKTLLWEGDGFLLPYRRLDNGAFRWPRSAKEALELPEWQYEMLKIKKCKSCRNTSENHRRSVKNNAAARAPDICQGTYDLTFTM